jgi:hypothetical protein
LMTSPPNSSAELTKISSTTGTTQRREFMAISGGVNQHVVELSRKFRAVENRYNAREVSGDSQCATSWLS